MSPKNDTVAQPNNTKNEIDTDPSWHLASNEPVSHAFRIADPSLLQTRTTLRLRL